MTAGRGVRKTWLHNTVEGGTLCKNICSAETTECLVKEMRDEYDYKRATDK